MANVDLKERSVQEIEAVLADYPWFVHARKELMIKMSKMGEEYRRDVLHRTALYVYPDYKAFRNAYLLSQRAEDSMRKEEIPVYDFELDDFYSVPEGSETGGEASVQILTEVSDQLVPEMQIDGNDADDEKKSRREIYVVGGDYFSSEELKKVSSPTAFNFSLSPEKEPVVQSKHTDASEFRDENYYTETLAGIYAEQELYDRANEIYEKLILLYPEKSAYFAALKDKLKKN